MNIASINKFLYGLLGLIFILVGSLTTLFLRGYRGILQGLTFAIQ